MKKLNLIISGFLLLLFVSCSEYGSVGGYVTLDDEGVSGVEVEIFYEGESSTLHTTYSGADGYYEFSDLATGVSYDISAFYEDEDQEYSAFKTFTLAANEDKDLNLELE